MRPESEPSFAQLAGLMASARLRVTPQRVALLHVLVRERGHLTVDELYRRVRAEMPGLSATSIYKSLHALRDAGLIRAVGLGAGALRYDANLGDRHHHRVCRICGRIDDVACTADCPAASTAGHDLGPFTCEDVEVIYRGVCAECQGSAKRSDSAVDGETR